LGGWFFGPHNGYAQSVSRSAGQSVGRAVNAARSRRTVVASAVCVRRVFWGQRSAPSTLSLGTEMGVAEKGRIRRRRREDGALFGLRGRL